MSAPMPVAALLYRLGFLDADLMKKMGVKVKGLTSAAIIFFVGGKGSITWLIFYYCDTFYHSSW
ncbi:hypothetical protein [Cytobacillus kochii]|uniref:hypothetical protein n=1 Tax=Cytobacillus kochii TaxID=859143 RepID=UPI002040D626|nr:hypothetical protein [Cytobacillus kochii]MCM3321254.1 hypothetical protein [Cytobacillus kochii]MCM3343912.1 hypothetical protein [Cytobacillus kochii]